MAAFTALRKGIYYPTHADNGSISFTFAEQVIKIKAENPELSELEALQINHYAQLDSASKDALHNLMEHPSPLVDFDTLLQGFNKGKDCNDAFKHPTKTVNKTWDELHKIGKEDIKKLIPILKTV